MSDSKEEEDLDRRASAVRASVYDFDASFVNEVRGFMKGEEETLNKILDEVDKISLKRSAEGLNELNFTCGVLNCFFIVYIFGAYPQHMWLIFFVEGLYMLPKRFFIMWRAQPLNEALYYLDFCWIMNFSGSFLLFVLIFVGIVGGGGIAVSDVAREACFNAFLGVSLGPLMGANIVLPFVACLFHDVSTMTGLFIHLMPPMCMYTFLWKGSLIKDVSQEMRVKKSSIFYLMYFLIPFDRLGAVYFTWIIWIISIISQKAVT